MKVFQINVDCGCYSTGKIASDIGNTLIENNEECIIAYGREYKAVKTESYLIDNKYEVIIHAALSRAFDSQGLHSSLATKKLIKKIISYKPDIIHLHNIHGYYLNYEILFNFLNIYGKPIVWTLHDCWPFTGHCAYFDYINCNKWEQVCYSCPQLRTYPKSFCFDRSRKNYELKKKLFSETPNLTIVTPSDWLGELVRRSFLKHHRVIVIHNGINTELYKHSENNVYKKYGLSDKRIILGVATPWSERKGLKDFIELSKIISDEYRVFLVGLSDEQILNLPDNVIGIKKTLNVQELVDLYSGAYVFLNLTYEDNYPTTNLEAQACGTPVITYDTGGSIESVPANQVVSQGDIKGAYSILSSGNLKVGDRNSYDRRLMVHGYTNLYHMLTGD